MNNVGFRYGTMGLQNMTALADLDTQRRKAQYQIDREAQQAEGQAIGTLVGGLAGGVKGYYNKNKEQHDAQQATKQQAATADDTRRYVDHLIKGTPYEEPAPFTPEEFDFVRSVKQDLEALGWM